MIETNAFLEFFPLWVFISSF